MAKPRRRHLSAISARKRPSDLRVRLRDSNGKRRIDRVVDPPARRHDSDDDSWIEVKKQRVIIVIPALPQPPSTPRRLRNRDPLCLAKRKREKDGRDGNSKEKTEGGPQDVPSAALDVLGKDGSVAPERLTEENISTYANPAVDGANRVYAKRKWKDRNSSECEIKKKRLVSEHSKQMLYNSDRPISSMDILLASALDAQHADSASWQELHKDDLLVRNGGEDLSLDTADSGTRLKEASTAAKHALPSPSKSVTTRKTCTSIQRSQNYVATEPLAPMRGPGNERVTTSLDVAADRDIPSTTGNEAGLLKCIQAPPILTANQAFRVSMLKKHLDKVGGFGKWLCLVGLDQFQEAFEKRIWSEVELLQLNMEDLKSMGKPAVGPRRKLIWAIHRLSKQLVL